MITAQAQEYLEAIYRLGGHLEPVPLSDLAEQLDLTAPSVNEMVRRLEEQGLVRYAPYKGVQLSEKGACEALAVLRRHRLWERFLTDMLGLPWDVVHEEACRLEHAASDDVTEKLAELLDHPERCPHGKPLPPPGCQPVSPPEAVPLTKLQPQQRGQVAYIAREEPELLRYMESLGLLPDAQVIVEQVAPFDGPITVRVNDQTQVIGHNAAQTVYIIQGET
ncbi:MAG: metal-dependent transcriptional regulator, partial [Anaerolineae bacterium]|nr:metal-dependent transcriptional regulator [Anaerolineae bacterium]